VDELYSVGGNDKKFHSNYKRERERIRMGVGYKTKVKLIKIHEIDVFITENNHKRAVGFQVIKSNDVLGCG
jgi:hypothetical protein